MSVEIRRKKSARRYALVLWILTVLFCFRVVAQLVQVWYPVEFLPAFDRWHSGALPYHWLVATQGMILGMCLLIVWHLFNNRVIPSPKKGRVLVTLGLIYFGGMCIRLLLGTTVASEHEWFGATLPTVFHLVLALFIMVYGRFHCLAFRLEPFFPQRPSQ